MGTGGETLDTVVKTNTTTADPTGNPNFNAKNIEKATGNYWGVMALTLDRTATSGISSRHWNSRSCCRALLQRHGLRQLPRRTGNCQFVFAALVNLPRPPRNVAEGGDFYVASSPPNLPLR